MSKQKLVVLSIDALLWEDLENLKHMPGFQWLLEQGAHVERMRSVYPTVTYVCHTSMLTGCWPDRHGVIANEPHLAGVRKLPWNFYHEAVRCPDILDACKAAGLTTAAVGWPVTGNHPHVDYLVDEIWPSSDYSAETFRQAILESGTPQWLFDRVVAPHLWMRVARAQPDSSYFSVAIACDMIRNYRPDALFIHVGNMDHYRHRSGVFGARTDSAAAECEKMLTDLILATREAGVFADTNFVVTADHGQMDCARTAYPNVLLRENGLIETDEDGNVTDWQAWCFSCGMSVQIVLKNPEDRDLWNRVYGLLKQYRDMGVWGFSEVWTAEEVARREHLRGDFSFVLETDNYTQYGGAWMGAYAVPTAPGLTTNRAGNHGFHPSKGPRPPFLACGPAFRRGAVLREASILDGAPTYARILGVDLPDTDGRVLEELL